MLQHRQRAGTNAENLDSRQRSTVRPMTMIPSFEPKLETSLDLDLKIRKAIIWVRMCRSLHQLVAVILQDVGIILEIDTIGAVEIPILVQTARVKGLVELCSVPNGAMNWSSGSNPLSHLNIKSLNDEIIWVSWGVFSRNASSTEQSESAWVLTLHSIGCAASGAPVNLHIMCPRVINRHGWIRKNQWCLGTEVRFRE